MEVGDGGRGTGTGTGDGPVDGRVLFFSSSILISWCFARMYSR